MSASPHIKLAHPPIKEIVINISFDEALDKSVLDKLKECKNISNEYTIITPGFNAQIKAVATSAPEANVSFDGYLMRSPKSSNVIQARKSSLSFHKVNGYEDFETLIIRFKEIWQLLLSFVNMDLTISNISLRYSNYIKKDKDSSIKDYIKVVLTHPFENNLSDAFMILRFNNYDNKSIVGNLTIASNKDQDGEGIVLDINATKLFSQKLKSSNFTFDIFNELRGVKNEIFFNTITEQTILKYNS